MITVLNHEHRVAVRCLEFEVRFCLLTVDGKHTMCATFIPANHICDSSVEPAIPTVKSIFSEAGGMGHGIEPTRLVSTLLCQSPTKRRKFFAI